MSKVGTSIYHTQMWTFCHKLFLTGFEEKRSSECSYTLSDARSGVNWADLMAVQGTFGTDFHDRSILRPKPLSLSGRPVIKIGPKGALGSHEIRPIHSAPSLGQSIRVVVEYSWVWLNYLTTTP